MRASQVWHSIYFTIMYMRAMCKNVHPLIGSVCYRLRHQLYTATMQIPPLPHIEIRLALFTFQLTKLRVSKATKSGNKQHQNSRNGTPTPANFESILRVVVVANTLFC